MGYVNTHIGRAVVPPDHLGVAHENVTFTTGDGLELEGWYVPSRNGAAVIAFPGRNGPQAQGADARPPRLRRAAVRPPRRGQERGRAERVGLGRRGGHQGRDRVPAAPAGRRPRPDRRHRALRRRRADDPGRRRDRRARGRRVGGRRSAVDRPRTWTTTTPPCAKWTLGFALSAAKTVAVAVSSNQAPPANLKDLAAKVEQPMLLIAAPNSPNGEELNRGYAKAAGDSATLWEIPESRPHRRPEGAPAGVRAARGRLLRLGAGAMSRRSSSG